MTTRDTISFAAVVLATCLGAVDLASAQIFQLTGEITNGAFFVPAPGGGPEMVFRDFPVDYKGTFIYQSAGSLARFHFTSDVGGTPVTLTIPENLFPGIVQNDAEALVVDYLTAPPQASMTSFQLTLNKGTGEGQWVWRDLCFVCDRIVDPFAEATITSYLLIPEIPGDYDANGRVDAADYTVWRDAGPTETLPNDPTPGVVDAEDYTTWAANFGKTSANSAGLSAIPEPATFMLAVVAVFVALAVRPL